jgi:hypothetical protein
LPRLAGETTVLSLDEMRTRSYPSFTRIVLETSGPVTYRVEPGGPREMRVRLLGLTADAQTESIGDGFVEQARLERAGRRHAPARELRGYPPVS